MSLGLTATSVTFTDSNESIVIDDCPHTYAEFNKVEINNASSSVTWNNITMTSTATTTVALGRFEVIDNATVTLVGCSFNDMDTFIFQSNSTLTSCNFNGCGQITAGSATITGCNINNSTSATSLLAGTNDMTNITSNAFDSDGSNHAVEINSVGTGSMTWNNTLVDYVTGTAGNNITGSSTGNEAIYLNFTSAATYTINVSAGATTPSIRKGAGMTGQVNVVAGAVSINVKAVETDGTAVSGARVFVETTSGSGTLPYQDSVSITRSGSTATVTHTAHGLSAGDKVVIRGANQTEYVSIFTISNVTTNTYDVTVTGTPATPATGSPVASFVFISGTTDVNGEISSPARTLSTNQAIKGTVRKSSGSPLFKSAPIVGTIDSTNGASVTAVMISDE